MCKYKMSLTIVLDVFPIPIFAGWSRWNMAVTHYVQINLCTLRYFLVS